MSTVRLELQLSDPFLGLCSCWQTHCVAACCGLDAFDFNAESVRPWIRKNPLSTTWEALDQLAGILQDVSGHSGTVNSQDDFNNWWATSGECEVFFRELQAHIFRAFEFEMGAGVRIQATWLTSAVVALARGIYADRAFDRLPILADALQDAGCDSDSVLSHCRDAGPHARGCWVVDLLIGRAGVGHSGM